MYGAVHRKSKNISRACPRHCHLAWYSIDNAQVIDFAECRFVNHVNFDSEVRIGFRVLAFVVYGRPFFRRPPKRCNCGAD